MAFTNMGAERKRHGVEKNRDFADLLGVSKRTITNWMSGKTEIPAGKLILLARIWNCSIDYLLDRSDRQNSAS